MRDDLSRVIAPTGPSPTIGDRGVRLHEHAIRRRFDFYDTAGRMNGLIVLLPIIYGVVETQGGRELQPWFWWLMLTTVAFAVFVRRPPFVRLTPKGICFPEKRSPLYLWNQMCEAHARADELEILLSSGEHVTISYRKLRRYDIERIRRLIKSQFQWMSQQARASAEAA
jgi:hypothetical protein